MFYSLPGLSQMAYTDDVADKPITDRGSSNSEASFLSDDMRKQGRRSDWSVESDKNEAASDTESKFNDKKLYVLLIIIIEYVESMALRFYVVGEC